MPVLLDGAQGVGAVPIDVGALGCAFYAGSGQKWLCGPVGTGMLWIAPELARATCCRSAPTYINLAEPGARARVRRCTADAAPHDSPALSAEAARARGRRARRARRGRLGRGLRARARARRRARRPPARARPHGRRRAATTTLVSWEDDDPEATRDRLAGAGIIVRNLPGHAVPARVGRRVERRGRPRAAAGRPLGRRRTACIEGGHEAGIDS